VLLACHLAAVATWLGVGLGAQWVAAKARGAGPLREVAIRRRLGPAFCVEHVAIALALLTGFLLMWTRGWHLGQARWLDLKVGLVMFVVVPLEAMHAFVVHVWVAWGLRRTDGEPLERNLSRGLGIEEMIRAIGLPLLGLAVPLVLWLSFAVPF
jgi:hypothetical protein